jgi:hypothetical protein
MCRVAWLFAEFAPGAVQADEPTSNAESRGTIEAILGKFAALGSLAPGQ